MNMYCSMDSVNYSTSFAHHNNINITKDTFSHNLWYVVTHDASYIHVVCSVFNSLAMKIAEGFKQPQESNYNCLNI